MNDKNQLHPESESKGRLDTFVPMTEKQMIQRLEISRKTAERGLYRDADEVIADFRMKYGL